MFAKQHTVVKQPRLKRKVKHNDIALLKLLPPPVPLVILKQGIMKRKVLTKLNTETNI
jgi:hypothetical protein